MKPKHCVCGNVVPNLLTYLGSGEYLAVISLSPTPETTKPKGGKRKRRESEEQLPLFEDIPSPSNVTPIRKAKKGFGALVAVSGMYGGPSP